MIDERAWLTMVAFLVIGGGLLFIGVEHLALFLWHHVAIFWR